MEPLLTRASSLYPPGIRRLLLAPQCLNPYTQTRFASRRDRRKTKPTEPNKLDSPPNDSLISPPRQEPRTGSAPEPAPTSLPSETPTPKPAKKKSERPRRILESPGRKLPFDGLKFQNTNAVLSLYWNSVAPSEASLARANELFTSPKTCAKFLIGVEKFRQVPRSTVPEVAFLGRSNVGKSSLLNALFAQKLAHTSGRPGRTTSMNFYGVGGIGHGGASLKRGPNNHMNIEGEGGLVVVDTPGYGFASREGWGTEVLKYLTDREQLRRVFLLVDAGHGLKQQDKQILKILHSSGVPYQVLLSKADKVYIPDIGKYFSTRLAHNAKRVKPRGTLEELHAMMNSIREYIGEENCYEMLACSGEVKLNGRLLGIDNVRYSVMKSTLGVKEEERPPSIFEQKGGIRKMHVSLIKRNPDTVFA